MYTKKITELFNLLSDYCEAVYLGGSQIDPVIENPHDYDYVCFSAPETLADLLIKMETLGYPQRDGTEATKPKTLLDFTQIRIISDPTINWMSYLDCLMTKVIGKEVCPKTDIIKEHRKEYLTDIRKKVCRLLTEEEWIKHPKRWYYALRGIYILINNSYDVTEDQKREINILHDLSDGWEKVRDKTILLLKQLIKDEQQKGA